MQSENRSLLCGKDLKTVTDAQLITSLVAEQFNKGVSLKEALKLVVGAKLLGTYRIAAMELENPKTLIFVKNSGDFSLSLSHNKDELIVSSEQSLFADQNIRQKFEYSVPIPNNQILEVNEDCTYRFEKIEKVIKIDRNPKAMFNHIFQEQVFESIDSIELVTDFGGKFITDNAVLLGGFQKARNELMLIEDLIISALGSSKIASEYGAYIMRELRIFNTIKVSDATYIKEKDFKDYRYGGFLTVS